MSRSSTNAKYSIKENLFSTNTFSSLNLHPHLIDCIQKRFNLSKMTQIQEKTIPIILKGVDCFVKSQTGKEDTNLLLIAYCFFKCVVSIRFG